MLKPRCDIEAVFYSYSLALLLGHAGDGYCSCWICFKAEGPITSFLLCKYSKQMPAVLHGGPATGCSVICRLISCFGGISRRHASQVSKSCRPVPEIPLLPRFLRSFCGRFLPLLSPREAERSLASTPALSSPVSLFPRGQASMPQVPISTWALTSLYPGWMIILAWGPLQERWQAGGEEGWGRKGADLV